jgi:hypothetical protein
MEIKISGHDVDRIIISSLREICWVFWTPLLTNALTDVMKLVIATWQPLLGRQLPSVDRQGAATYCQYTKSLLKCEKKTAINYETVGLWAGYLSPTNQ